MSTLDNFKLFIISRILGLIFLIVAIFLFVSLISFNENDISFGNVNSSLNTVNYLGAHGAYISGLLLVLLNYSSYLIPVFFLIIGIKFVFGIKCNNLIIRFFSLLIGLCILNFSLTFVNIAAGLVGKIFFDITESFLLNFQNDIFFKWAIFPWSIC